MKPKQLRVIKCPKCGYEYLPAEIYLPDEFLGKPKNIVRNVEGKLMGYEGIKMNDTETYYCDNCGELFESVSTTNFTTKLIGESSNDYVTRLNINKLFLQEN